MPDDLTPAEERSICAECYAHRYALNAAALEAWMERHGQRAYNLELAIRERGSDALVVALLNDEPLAQEARS